MYSWYVFVLSILVIGFLFGWRRKKPTHGKRTYMGLAVLAIIGFPMGTLLLAKLFDSHALGWLFGLTLIFGLPLVLLFGLGLAVGSFFNRASDEKDTRESAVQPTIDQRLGVMLSSSPNEAPIPLGTNGPLTVPRRTAAPSPAAAANCTTRPPEAYDVVTCRHLHPIEHAMRLDGLEMRRENVGRLNANCCIDFPKLDGIFGSAVAALYVERHEIDRSYLDPKSALFWCDACQCRLAVVHPEEAGPATPWFPRKNPDRY